MIRGSIGRIAGGKYNFAAALLGTTAMAMLAPPRLLRKTPRRRMKEAVSPTNRRMMRSS